MAASPAPPREWRSELRRIGSPAFARRPRDWWLIIVGLLIFWCVYSGPPASSFAGIDLRFGLTGPISGDPWKWAGALLLVGLVIWGERRGLSSLLISKPSAKDVEWAFIVFGVVMAWSWVAGLIAPQAENEGVSIITSMGIPGVLVLIVTAAVTEEIAFRGYLQERIGALTRSRWIGAFASLLSFVAPHIAFFGQSWLLHQFAGALALVLFTLIRRNLLATMLLHGLINAPILIPTVIALS